MIFECPECGRRQRAARPGSVVPCVGCRNPIVVPEPSQPEAPPAPRSAPPDAGGTKRLWGTAGLVLLIVAAAHAGLYLLLSADARGSLRAIERAHTPSELRAAPKPGDAPKPGTPAYAAWRRAVELHDDARAWEDHRRHVTLLRDGFLASFLVQLAITGWILLRVLGKQRRRQRAARRS